MAKFKLSAGGEIELLTPGEYDSGIQRLSDKIDAAIAAPPIMERVAVNVTTTAGGTIGGGAGGPGFVVYTCPEGRAARLVRVALNTVAATPAAPLAGGAWMEGFVDSPSSPGNLVFAVPTVGQTTAAPVVLSDGTSSATVLRNGQQLVVVGAGLGAAVVIGIGVQVWLYESSVA